jgi:hypothetical protein
MQDEIAHEMPIPDAQEAPPGQVRKLMHEILAFYRSLIIDYEALLK